jgi:hypothetical protein
LRRRVRELDDSAVRADTRGGPLSNGRQCDVVGIRFFVAVPDGGDAYALKSVLND